MQSLDVTRLMKMSQAELDDLFRGSPSGEIPRGEGKGTLLVAPGTKLGEIVSYLVHLFAWQGKVFDPERGKLRNVVSPLGIQAVAATVSKGPSLFDGKECIVLDYSQTSRIAHRVRDEIRLVTPDLYLGIAFWNRVKIVHFALSFHLKCGGEGATAGRFDRRTIDGRAQVAEIDLETRSDAS